MNSRKAFAAVSLLFLAAAAAGPEFAVLAAQEGDAEKPAASDPAAAGEDLPEYEMVQYWVGLISKGPSWSPGLTKEVEMIQQGHMDNITRLAEEGKLVLAGPFGGDGDLRGLFFFKVATKEQAEALVAGDPAVRAGRLKVDLHPWWGPKRLENIVKNKQGP